jgi:aryl-alcohol dehydrogenase-like predicted oxidoreductase
MRPQILARVSRRSALGLTGAAAVGAVLSRGRAFASDRPLPTIVRKIPSTGEQMPAVGIGTNAYDVSSREDLAARREVLRAMPELGGRLIDTARGYGRSEEVIGTLLAELGNRDSFFIATKPVSAPQANEPITQALIEESFVRLRTRRIDLLQVHSLLRFDDLMPRFEEYKRAGRIRYIGVTTASARTHEQLLTVMRRHPLDFIQVDYSIDDRSAAQQVLPLAQEKGTAMGGPVARVAVTHYRFKMVS